MSHREARIGLGVCQDASLFAVPGASSPDGPRALRPQARHHFTRFDQVNQLAAARETEQWDRRA